MMHGKERIKSRTKSKIKDAMLEIREGKYPWIRGSMNQTSIYQRIDVSMYRCINIGRGQGQGLGGLAGKALGAEVPAVPLVLLILP